MAYEIIMPQLSDSMEEGKLISWKVKEGDYVKRGDVIAEVESDKAIMEVQSFKDGVINSIKVKEAQSVPVGTIIAILDTDMKDKKKTKSTNNKIEKKPLPISHKQQPHISYNSVLDEILELNNKEDKDIILKTEAEASPKAKALGAKYKIDLNRLQKDGKLPTPAHQEDIHRYYLQHFFTPKALELLKLYHLDPSLFTKDKKHDSEDIFAYIKEHDILLPKPITSFQKALIQTVIKASKKPIFHIFDHIDTTELFKHKTYTITVWLLKIFAQSMMAHESFRSTLKGDNEVVVQPNASISLAIANGNLLYMPVFKNLNLLTTFEIDQQLKAYEQKAKEGKMLSTQMQGSTFGISNLGMLGVERFDAMINQDDSAIGAIGTAVDGKMSITLTLDHRLINGYQAAKFMQTLKEIVLDPRSYKE